MVFRVFRVMIVIHSIHCVIIVPSGTDSESELLASSTQLQFDEDPEFSVHSIHASNAPLEALRRFAVVTLSCELIATPTVCAVQLLVDGAA